MVPLVLLTILLPLLMKDMDFEHQVRRPTELLWPSHYILCYSGLHFKIFRGGGGKLCPDL